MNSGDPLVYGLVLPQHDYDWKVVSRVVKGGVVNNEQVGIRAMALQLSCCGMPM